MEGKRLLRSLTLKNVLSFGPEGMTLDFEPLNVLIGANGSGKSNLIDILGLQRSLIRDMSSPILEGGGMRQWIWKGTETETHFEIESRWNSESLCTPICHRLVIGGAIGRGEVLEEVIQHNEYSLPEYQYQNLRKNAFSGPDIFDHKGNFLIEMDKSGFKTDQSILSQRRDPERYPKLAYLGDRYSEIRLYRDWVFGRSAQARELQLAGDFDEYLSEDATNLSLVLRRILNDKAAGPRLEDAFKAVYDDVNGIHIQEIGEYLRISIREDESRFIPASRLSDGTLRFLSLLTILYDPNPPSLVCIEEPELGMHPDIIPTIGKLLIEASQRTQLIVTTHSADLISALWESPESVVVCERGFEGTTMKRLDPERMKKWMERYSLGDLWGSGEIGGKRW